MPDEQKPDWRVLVRDRLELAELSQAQQDETIAELASHLDELFERYRKQGLREAEAVARATHEVSDWRGLAKTIQRSKFEEGSMNERTKQLWLPALLSTALGLVLPILLLMSLNRLGVEPGRYYARAIGSLWLLASAFGGATGAYLSRRAGGKRLARLASALFPVAVFVVAVAFVCSFTVLVHSFGASQFTNWRELASMTLIYGTASLLGTLPFLRSRRSGDSEVSHA